jgi:1-acyl-sn-glycerol-3-phosphate acyltransferase
MSGVRNILNALYSGYCIALFFVMMFILMFAYAAVFFLNDRTRTLTAYYCNRVLSAGWLWVCGYRVIVEGAEKIDKNKTYMFVGNHSNMLDLPVTGFFLQHYYKSLAKKELKRVPIFGFLIRISSILVDRSSAESRRRSTQMVVDSLKNGISILIFPEGTRNKTDKPLGPFHSGAFKTALMAQVPVLPFVFTGIRSLQPVGTWRLYPGTIHVKVFDAIETEGMTTSDVAVLQDKVYTLLEEVILKEDEDFVEKE